jgi:adenylyl-sulfate kinase
VKTGIGGLKPAVLWFTGLSGSGKTTIATLVHEKLVAGGRPSELLDGDEIRALFPKMGFTREDRNQQVMRVGHLASVLEKHGIFSVGCLVSPYAESRDFVRRLCRSFVEIYVSTPLEVCEKRDVKGLYAKARRGEIAGFTGIDDPYEPPAAPELEIDTTILSAAQAVDKVFAFLYHLALTP